MAISRFNNLILGFYIQQKNKVCLVLKEKKSLFEVHRLYTVL